MSLIDKIPLTVALFAALTLGLALFKGLHEVDVTAIAAVTIILCVPPLALFFFAQRYIMDSAIGSSVKG